MKPPVGVTLVSAKYVTDYKFLFTFSNKKESLVDFKPIISFGTSLLGFLDVTEFKKMQYDENGYIWWGENWDMCFHIETYYNETAIHPVKQKVLAK